MLLDDAICISYLTVTGVNVRFDMLTGGASVLNWFGYKAQGLMGRIGSTGAWLNALQA